MTDSKRNCSVFPEMLKCAGFSKHYQMDYAWQLHSRMDSAKRTRTRHTLRGKTSQKTSCTISGERKRKRRTSPDSCPDTASESERRFSDLRMFPAVVQIPGAVKIPRRLRFS